MAEHYVEVPDGHTAALGVDGTAKQADGNHSAKAGVYNPKAMVGTVLEDFEDEDLPFWWFNSFSQFWWWLIEWLIPGLGMWCEAYFIFSIGNIKPIITAQYPACWKTYQKCAKTLTEAPDYTQVIGIIMGMTLLGVIGDTIGRKWGSVTTASIMLLGAAMLTATNGVTAKGFTIMYLISQMVFGFGVGGEYPMAAGSAAERAEAGGKAMAKKRGREVVLTFSMQGVGNFMNVAVLLILMACFDTIVPNHHDKNNPYHFRRLEGVWRTAFALGIPVILFIIFWRVFKLRESAVWAAHRGTQDRRANFGLLMRHFGHRLVATAGSWFLWDFSFYGNKVFQSEFIAILSPGASIFTTLLWTLLNSGCALVGYWLTAAVVDHPYWGRLRTQIFGFMMVGILFMVAAIWYHPLTTKGGIGTFQFIYFFSSFWGQFGPNCTTFLLAGELYPTPVRTTAHGISAGTAKVGALWAVVWFNYLGNRTKFWLTASFNFGGMFLTALMMPDPMRVSLSELDRRWEHIRAGTIYHGEAVAPRNTSWFERMIGVCRAYNPKLDEEDLYQEKVPNWRIASMSRGSVSASPSARLTGDGVAAA